MIENFAEQTDKDMMDIDVADLEMQAYAALHPTLKQTLLGHYVAVYHGQLIDHDTDRRALYMRIVARYPDEFVWMCKVEEEPFRTFVFRSPRFLRESPA